MAPSGLINHVAHQGVEPACSKFAVGKFHNEGNINHRV